MKRKVLSVFAGIFLVGFCITASASAATPPNKFYQPTKPTKVTADTISKLSDGGTEYDFTINGYKVVSLVPPAGFNVASSSDKDLVKYGFREKPKDLKELQEGKTLYSGAKHAVTPSLKILPQTSDFTESSENNTTKFSASHESGNWGGYENYQTSSNKYSEVWGYYEQPYDNDPVQSGNATAYESSWVGIGGDVIYYKDHKLIQCGTAMDNGNNGEMYSWFEWLNDELHVGVPMIEVDGLGIYPTCDIAADVRYDEANQTAYFTVINETTGYYFSYYVDLPASTYFSGKTAEWIDEAISINGEVVPLADYGTISWNDCEAYVDNEGWNYLGNRPSNAITMKNKSGAVKSIPSGIGDDSKSFLDIFVRSN
jgi:hypothetical protein